VVHALRVFKHYLLGSGAPRPLGCGSDFDLRTDKQATTWLKTNRHLNKMYVRWLDEIEDFGRARTGCLDGGSRPGESAGAVFSAGARRAVPRGAGCHSGRVGSNLAGGSGLVRWR
jgi:hypothetical protein